MKELSTEDMSKSIYIRVVDLFKEIRDSYVDTFNRITNPGEEPLSKELRTMLSNPSDRKKYLDALDKLKKKREKGELLPEEKIELSTGEEIILTTVS